MNLRTPRRRISPRTVRRYQAIKKFMRRALGSSSQPDVINPSITVSVLDFKQKIDGIEQQLNTVNKHCRDLASLESRLRLRNSLESETDTDADTKNIKIPQTEVLDKPSQSRCHKTVNNKTSKIIVHADETVTNVTTVNKMLDQNNSYSYKENKKSKPSHKLDPIQENGQILRNRRDNVASRTLPAHLPKFSYHSFNEPKTCNHHVSYLEVRRQRHRKKIDSETNKEVVNVHNNMDQRSRENKNHTNKYLRPELDQDFIADIIRRQYRPVKLLGRRESDFSQFSAPVCRDQEYPIRETVKQGSDLCSCCHEEHNRDRHSRYMCSNDLSDMRSICDTRLYSSRKHNHHTNYTKHSNDLYYDSLMYDVIPVKEKSSPKSRRKFAEDNMLMQEKYREVPPSPRTQRPRLNLQAQFYSEGDENGIPSENELKHIKKLQLNSMLKNEGNNSNMSSEVFIHNRNFSGRQNPQCSNTPKLFNEECVGTMSSLQYPALMQEQPITNNDTTLNTQTTDVSADKTDKTLSEIKNILHSFLQEIKKESSQSDKFKNLPQSDPQIKSNNFNNNNNFGHCGVPPFMQSFPNSCCYPILPVCPMNCLQNGFVLPSPSITCAACANNSKEQTCGSNDLKNKTSISDVKNSETQKLIKEIYNLISQNPNSIKKNNFHNNNNIAIGKNTETQALTSRSVGGSFKVSKHDAKVGTRKMKCQSKSCEAIGLREATDERYAANITYSDTVLDKGSGEEILTESASESDYSIESTITVKKKVNKFTKMLRSIGILKGNKTDVIEGISGSNSNADIEKSKQGAPYPSHPRSPFQQHIINYNVHGQKYFHPPITPHQLQQHQYEYCGHSRYYNPRTCCSPTYVDNKSKISETQHFPKQDIQADCRSPHHISIPTCSNYYDPHYVNGSPPVCFKEIEVKSIGTQSIRKMSLLEKLTNKMQLPVQQVKKQSPKQSSIGTSSKDKNSKALPEANVFDWRKIHEKAMQKTTDPLKFSYKTQKRLAEGDNTMRNAMLKKLFYKRNPFSPRNLLVRTLLGKDRSSFGEPPKMYKPKMFL